MSKRTPRSVAIPDQCPAPKRLVSVSAAADRNSAIFNTSLSAASLSFIRIIANVEMTCANDGVTPAPQGTCPIQASGPVSGSTWSPFLLPSVLSHSCLQ